MNSITNFFAKQNDEKMIGDDLTLASNSKIDLARRLYRALVICFL